MGRLDPDSLPDRFELDRYARRLRQQEISHLTRRVAVGWHNWLRKWAGAAPSARRAASGALRMN